MPATSPPREHDSSAYVPVHALDGEGGAGETEVSRFFDERPDARLEEDLGAAELEYFGCDHRQDGQDLERRLTWVRRKTGDEKGKRRLGVGGCVGVGSGERGAGTSI